MWFLSPLFVLLAIAGVAAAAADSTQCGTSCLTWSHTLSNCRDAWGTQPTAPGFKPQLFLACLCVGNSTIKDSNGQYINSAIGNKSISEAASICGSCSSTPPLIKQNLQQFLKLCSIQEQNGTATNASNFAPISYDRGNDNGNSDNNNPSSAATSSSAKGSSGAKETKSAGRRQATLDPGLSFLSLGLGVASLLAGAAGAGLVKLL